MIGNGVRVRSYEQEQITIANICLLVAIIFFRISKSQISQSIVAAMPAMRPAGILSAGMNYHYLQSQNFK
jgi:hypothetical protein